MHATSKPLFRFAHISDLHFFKLSLNPSQLFSKRLLGNLNVLLSRKVAFDPDNLTTLFPVFHDKKIDGVLITGDLSSTSLEGEFILAQQFVQSLQTEGFRVFTLPGNHDHYTRNAYRKRLFYNFFTDRYDETSSYSLKEEGVTSTYLGKQWWLVALDTALATSFISSNGCFSSEIERHLEELLNKIPTDHSVILLNHFPLFSTRSPRKNLIRKEALQALLKKYNKVKLFLHGHSHRHSIADLRPSQLPLVLDSGSTGLKEGSWNLIEITGRGCVVEGLRKQNKGSYSSWEPFVKSHFTWSEDEALV